jgi:serine/threonine protein kinase
MCNSVLNVLEGLERVGLCWTDLRPENLVLVGGKLKAIDLESAVPLGARPVDCTPETTPPEVAGLYVSGRLAQARVDAKYDVWSFGVLMVYLASGGKTLYEGDQPGRIMQDMTTLTPQKMQQRIGSAVGNDARLRRVLESILVVDPEQRPTIKAVKGKWFFKSPL